MAVRMVHVELAARCLVDGEIHDAGDIVLLQEKAPDAEGKMQPFAEVFGKIVTTEAAKKAEAKVEKVAEADA